MTPKQLNPWLVSKKAENAKLCEVVFQKLEDYAISRHSNTISIFRDFDKDQSGALSLYEFQKALAVSVGQLSDAQWKAVMQTFDENGDGVIQYNELFGAIRNYKLRKRKGASFEHIQNKNPSDVVRSFTFKAQSARRNYLNSSRDQTKPGIRLRRTAHVPMPEHGGAPLGTIWPADGNGRGLTLNEICRPVGGSPMSIKPDRNTRGPNHPCHGKRRDSSKGPLHPGLRSCMDTEPTQPSPRDDFEMAMWKTVGKQAPESSSKIMRPKRAPSALLKHRSGTAPLGMSRRSKTSLGRRDSQSPLSSTHNLGALQDYLQNL